MLLAITNLPHQNKQMLRGDFERLQKNDRNYLRKNSIQKTLEILSNISKIKNKFSPFSLPQRPRRSLGRQQLLLLLLKNRTTSPQYLTKRDNKGARNSYGYRYGKYKPGSFVPPSEISLSSSNGGSKTQISLDRNLLSAKKIPNVQLTEG